MPDVKLPAVPEIPVTDVAAAADYYRRTLGFTVDWGVEELGLAAVSRGDCRLFLANQRYRRNPATPGQR